MHKKGLAALFSVLFLISGCSNSEEPRNEEKQEQESREIKQNKELTKKVTEEKGVVDGKVYEKDGIAVGEIVLEEKISDEDAKNLADRYVDEIAKKYKEMKVQVKAMRDGKTVVTINKLPTSTPTQAEKEKEENTKNKSEGELSVSGTVLNTLTGAYEIQDNTDVDRWGVVLFNDKLPSELQGGPNYELKIGEASYTLKLNAFNSNVYSVQVPSTLHTQTEVEAGTIYKVN